MDLLYLQNTADLLIGQSGSCDDVISEVITPLSPEGREKKWLPGVISEVIAPLPPQINNCCHGYLSVHAGESYIMHLKNESYVMDKNAFFSTQNKNNDINGYVMSF